MDRLKKWEISGKSWPNMVVHQGNRDSDSDKLTSMFSPFVSLQNKVRKKESNKQRLQGRLHNESEMLRDHILEILQQDERGETKCWSVR